MKKFKKIMIKKYYYVNYIENCKNEVQTPWLFIIET